MSLAGPRLSGHEEPVITRISCICKSRLFQPLVPICGFLVCFKRVSPDQIRQATSLDSLSIPSDRHTLALANGKVPIIIQNCDLPFVLTLRALHGIVGTDHGIEGINPHLLG